MRFMLLVKASEDSEAGRMPPQKVFEDMGKFNEELVKAGLMLAGEGLHPTSKGVRVRSANGKVTVTDGPFAETKELVAGYWLIQAKSLEEALSWVKRVPFDEGEIEVRPLFELEDFPVDPAEKPDGWREKEEQLRESPPPARKPGTKRYLGLLKADRDTEAGVMPKEEHLAAMGAFIEEGVKSGVILGGEGLKPTSQAKRVRFNGKKRTVIDGPFPETKELVAGYAILQASSRQEAIDWTKRFVAVDAPMRLGREATCELRPIFETEDFGDVLTPELRAQEDRLRKETEKAARRK
jgi:hypothetical protein